MSSPQSTRFRLDSGSAAELRAGLRAVADEFPARFGDGDGAGHVVTFAKQDGLAGFRIVPERAGVTIEYGAMRDAYRGLGVTMGQVIQHGAAEPRAEAAPFDDLIVMIDLSRNAVLKPESVKSLLARFALMGVNAVMLYLEDTFEIPGHPYFGHARGRYSAEQLRDIDDSAHRLGIEVIPFVQTLGHLGQVLKWRTYHDVRDTSDVLLVGDADADALVRDMLKAVSAPLRSKRIHIGMDEAHGLGSGIFRLRNGAQPAFEVFTQQLRRVADICGELDLEPWMFSDMFFRFGSKTNSQYDLDAVVPQAVAEQIPDDVRLIYWDYYHQDTEFYVEQIRRHRALGSEPIYAAGAMSWTQLWAQNPTSLRVTDLGMRAARDEGISQVMMTIWGDDGVECDYFSALPAVQGFADAAFEGSTQSEHSAANLRGSCDVTLETWLRASDIDGGPAATLVGQGVVTDDGAFHPPNPSKWLLWLDPGLDLVEMTDGAAIASHYRRLAHEIAQNAKDGTPEDFRLEFVAELAAVLANKAELHGRLRRAYLDKDIDTVRDLTGRVIPALCDAVEQLRLSHRERWFRIYKTFGWEVLDVRYGGLRARLATLRDVLLGWLDDPTQAIDTLDEPQLPIVGTGNMAQALPYRRVASASTP